MLLRSLLCWKTEGTHIVASYALAAAKNTEVLSPDFLGRWFRLASIPSRLQGANYYSNWLGYGSAQDHEVAAEFLERCLRESARMNDDQRDKLIAEVVFFLAYRRKDLDKAAVWSKRLLFPDKLDPISKARISVALACTHANFDEAIVAIEKVLALIRESPTSKERQRSELSWIAWRQEIQNRTLTGLPSDSSDVPCGIGRLS